jgi:hypothetical protein
MLKGPAPQEGVAKTCTLSTGATSFATDHSLQVRLPVEWLDWPLRLDGMCLLLFEFLD